MGGGTSRWRTAAKKLGFPCPSFFSSQTHHALPSKSSSGVAVSKTAEKTDEVPNMADTRGLAANKSLCAICLEPLAHNSPAAAVADGQQIFMAECSHAFHFPCINSNVRHGNVTCPICRANWTRLPRDLAVPGLHRNDPILRILDDSIATSRVNRRTSLRSTRYDDDDPVEPDSAPDHPRLSLTLIPAPCNHLLLASTTSSNRQSLCYLSVKLAHQRPMDLVLVATPNGPHLRLLKQSMALAVFSLRCVDRLAIVTYSSSAIRAFPLRRMSAHGKRTALQAIDRLFYLGQADPTEGLRKGVKILEDRTHQNPLSFILHLSDSPTRPYANDELRVPVQIHRFHIGFGYGLSNGFVMHEFEEFLARLLGGAVEEAQLRIGDNVGWIRLGELRGGEERRIPVDMKDGCRFVCVGYSYVDGGAEERARTGEVVVEIGEKRERLDGEHRAEATEVSGGNGRRSSVERRDYLDPFMARRWAKHLHGYRA